MAVAQANAKLTHCHDFLVDKIWILDDSLCDERERERKTDIIEIASNDMDIGRERFQVVHCFFGAQVTRA